MERLGLSGCALVIGAALALLAGCGGSQPPIGVPDTMPHTSALAARAKGTNYGVIYSFSGSPDGGYPDASLIDVGGTLYGTTEGGGRYNEGGTVFSVTPGGAENVLHSFGNSPDGNNPEAGLMDASGTLYGTTSSGGANTRTGRCTGSDYFPCGTVFSITPNGTESVLHSFGAGTDGLNPVASLIDVKETFYGTTENGGIGKRCNGGCGTVFSISPGGTYRVLHRFGRSDGDGRKPASPLIEVKGKLYGTTSGGGAYGLGTVFSISLSGRERVLHSFGQGTDGAVPSAALIDVDGRLYGTTAVGGYLTSSHSCNHTNSCGTVFSITQSGTEKILYRFTGDPDGAHPVAALVSVKGKLYGTTEFGGPYFCDYGGTCGTVFSITPSGAEKVLHSFGAGTDGVDPAAALIDVNGTLYGTTTGGGMYDHGTVFTLKP